VASHFSVAASKLVNALVTLAWVFTILLWLLGGAGIAIQWLGWGMSLDCIRGDPEYPCPTTFEASELTLAVIAGLGLLTVVVWYVARQLQKRH
jgi:hypothetical protein